MANRSDGAGVDGAGVDGVDVDGLLIWSLSPTLRETRRLTSREQMAMER